MDYFSKWPEAEAIKDKSANSVAIFLYKTICRYNIHCMCTFYDKTLKIFTVHFILTGLIIVMHGYFLHILHIDLGHQRS